LENFFQDYVGHTLLHYIILKKLPQGGSFEQEINRMPEGGLRALSGLF